MKHTVKISLGVIVLSYLSITEFIPYYFNHYQDNNGAGYANIHKVLMENPKSLTLRIATLRMLDDERMTAHEYTEFIALYNSEHGGLTGVPSGIEYDKEEFKTKLDNFFMLGNDISCSSSLGLPLVQISKLDNKYYGKFKPGHDGVEYVNLDGKKITLNAKDDWTCNDGDLNYFKVTNKPQPMVAA